MTDTPDSGSPDSPLALDPSKFEIIDGPKPAFVHPHSNRVFTPGEVDEYLSRWHTKSAGVKADPPPELPPNSLPKPDTSAAASREPRATTEPARPIEAQRSTGRRAVQSNAAHLKRGRMLHQYRLLEVLGAGGFGVTYLAKDETLKKLRAIKEYFPDDFARRKGSQVSAKRGLDNDFAWGKERLVEEAKVLARFKHPNIEAVVQIFEENGTAYIVKEYESGRDFKKWLKEIGQAPSQSELDDIVKPLLDALALLHRNDILHRDIAPDNIIIRDDGVPVLIDFGSAREAIAQRTRAISAVVKPGYSPHEQYSTRGRNQGPWSDIYAFGATLYHAVTGHAPEEATDRLVSDDIIPAAESATGKYRSGFLAAIDWALILAPGDRPQSVAEWQAALLAHDDAVPRTNRTKPQRDQPERLIPEIEQIISNADPAGLTGQSAEPAADSIGAVHPVAGAILLGATALLSAAMSVDLSIDPWALLQVNILGGEPAPVLPGAYFGFVMCLGIYVWARPPIVKLSIPLLGSVVAWIAAFQVAFWLVQYLTSGQPLGEAFDISKNYKAFELAGAAAGCLGSLIVTISVSLAVRKFATIVNLLRTVAAGSISGLLLDDHLIPKNDFMPSLSILYFVWQSVVAGSIGYGIAQIKYGERLTSAKDIRRLVLTPHAAALCASVVVVLFLHGVYQMQRAQESRTYNGAGTDRAKLRNYIETCRLCEYSAAAENQITTIQNEEADKEADEQQFNLARGDRTKLAEYVAQCKVCTFRADAEGEIAEIDTQQARDAETSQYTHASVNKSIESLRAYVQSCSMCENKSAAIQEIASLEREAQLFTFKVCNSTSYGAAVAVDGRKAGDLATWTVQGWWNVNSGSCLDIGKYAKGWIYAMAVVPGRFSLGWRGLGVKQCVNPNMTFEIKPPAQNYVCGPNEKAESFSSFQVSTDTYTWAITDSPVENPDDLFSFEVCNYSRDWASVAISGREAPSSAEWVVRGWWTVAPGQCSPIGRFSRGAFYAYAEVYGNSSRGWKGDGSNNWCVAYPGPFRRVNQPDFHCEANELKSFTYFVVTNATHRWTLGSGQ